MAAHFLFSMPRIFCAKKKNSAPALNIKNRALDFRLIRQSLGLIQIFRNFYNCFSDKSKIFFFQLKKKFVDLKQILSFFSIECDFLLLLKNIKTFLDKKLMLARGKS